MMQLSVVPLRWCLLRAVGPPQVLHKAWELQELQTSRTPSPGRTLGRREELGRHLLRQPRPLSESVSACKHQVRHACLSPLRPTCSSSAYSSDPTPLARVTGPTGKGEVKRKREVEIKESESFTALTEILRQREQRAQEEADRQGESLRMRVARRVSKLRAIASGLFAPTADSAEAMDSTTELSAADCTLLRRAEWDIDKNNEMAAALVRLLSHDEVDWESLSASELMRFIHFVYDE